MRVYIILVSKANWDNCLDTMVDRTFTDNQKAVDYLSRQKSVYSNFDMTKRLYDYAVEEFKKKYPHPKSCLPAKPRRSEYDNVEYFREDSRFYAEKMKDLDQEVQSYEDDFKSFKDRTALQLTKDGLNAEDIENEKSTRIEYSMVIQDTVD